MRKIKLSVGLLAFMGLAMLNYTQSESRIINNALASSGNDSWSSMTSWISDFWDSTSSIISSALSSFNEKTYVCKTRNCISPIIAIENDVPIIVGMRDGKEGYCDSGNERAHCFPPCAPLNCS